MSTVTDERVDDVLRDLLGTTSGPIIVVSPSATVIEEFIEVAAGMEAPTATWLLGEESTVKDVLEDFLLAASAADLVAEGVLSIRTTDATPGNQLLLTEDELTALVAAGDDLAALSTDDPRFVDSAYDHYAERWEDAEEYTLRTPALSRVRETLRQDIGGDVGADFEAVIGSLETARGDGDGLDEVTISLLVAAKNRELLYDISKWGEDVGIASKATFSRTKTTLEDLGLIDTEKVPIDVGRPRLRLKFADERLQDATADELASVAQSLLS